MSSGGSSWKRANSLAGVPDFFAALVMIIGLTVLLGWGMDLPRLTRVSAHWPAMQPLAATAFVLSGLALHFFGRRQRRRLGAVLLPLTLIAATALAQHWTGYWFGIDHLLFPAAVLAQSDFPHPGRMAEITAILFLIFGLFLLWPRRTSRGYRTASRLATLGLLSALAALAGYLLRAHDLARVGSSVSMSAPTALNFAFLFIGSLLAQRDPNWLHRLLSRSTGARLARQLLIHILGWPLLLGLAIPVLAPFIGDGRLVIGLYIVALSAALVIVVSRFARRLDRAEAQGNRARAALTMSQARLAGVLGSAMDSIITIDAGQRIIFFNAAAEALLNCSAAEAIGSPLERFIPERFRAAHAGHIRRFGENGVTSRHMGSLGVLKALRTDGTEFPIEASISQIEVNGQKLFTVILRDITEREQTEAFLRRSRQHLDLAVRGAGIGIWNLDVDSGEVVWSQRAREMFAIHPDERLCLEHILAALPEEDREPTLDALRAALGKRAEYRIEHRVVWPDGTVRWVAALGHGQYSEKGAPTGMSGILIDITEQKKAEKVLRQQASLLDLAHEPIMVWSGARGIVFWNQGCCSLYGYSPAEAQGKPCHELLKAVFPISLETILAELELKGDWNGEIRQTTRDGQVLIEDCRMQRLQFDGEVLILEANRDITQRKAMEDSLRRVNEMLEQQVAVRTAELLVSKDALEKSNLALSLSNQELSEFAYIAAHDLQTPLRSIAGFAQLLKQEYVGRLDSQADAWIETIVSNVKRMHVLIQNILSYARVESQGERFKAVDLGGLVDEVAADMASRIRESGAEVSRDELPVVKADAGQISQVVQNLIENGIKYRGADAPRIHLSAARRGQEWKIAVRDNGIGIHPRHHEKIFEVFRRLHTQQAYPGTGIGLSICRRVMHRHGGRIWVESEPGQGSTFYFTLPVAEEAGD